MKLGIDFDNTIVCYDGLFHHVALERALIPPDLAPGKNSVRDYLRKTDREETWMELQGYIYGERMIEAKPFPGALEFFRWADANGLPWCIISHRTRRPFIGPEYDLHACARKWLEMQGLPASNSSAPDAPKVFFELTKQAKAERIDREGCTDFIDDLLEFLTWAEFPLGVRRLLFDPHNKHSSHTDFPRVECWSNLAPRLNLFQGALT